MLTLSQSGRTLFPRQMFNISWCEDASCTIFTMLLLLFTSSPCAAWRPLWASISFCNPVRNKLPYTLLPACTFTHFIHFKWWRSTRPPCSNSETAWLDNSCVGAENLCRPSFFFSGISEGTDKESACIYKSHQFLSLVQIGLPRLDVV